MIHCLVDSCYNNNNNDNNNNDNNNNNNNNKIIAITTYLIYCDVNILSRLVMSQKVPLGGFKIEKCQD